MPDDNASIPFCTDPSPCDDGQTVISFRPLPAGPGQRRRHKAPWPPRSPDAPPVRSDPPGVSGQKPRQRNPTAGLFPLHRSSGHRIPRHRNQSPEPAAVSEAVPSKPDPWSAGTAALPVSGIPPTISDPSQSRFRNHSTIPG